MGIKNHGAEAMAGDICPNQGDDNGEVANNGEEAAEENQNQNQDNEEELEYEDPQHPPIPAAPSREEWLKHQIIHVPFKAW